MLGRKIPKVAPEAQCYEPYECPYLFHCEPPLDDYPVEILPRAAKVVAELLGEDFIDVRDIPEGYLKNDTHERIRRVTVSGKYELDIAGILQLDTLALVRLARFLHAV